MPGKGQVFALDGRQMAAFVGALEGGATVEAAAAAAGVAMSTLYYRRERDPAFAAAWEAGIAKSAGPVLVIGQCGRIYHKQQSRRVRFTRARKQIFLDHFAGSCNLAAAAAAAGVSTSAVRNHLRTDAAFADAFEEALALGYTLLEAEAARQIRAAQEKYRIDPEAAPADMAASFEQSLQLLRQYKRRDGTLGPRQMARAHLTKWNFQDAFQSLEKRLKAFGLRVERGEEAPDEEEED